MKSKPGPFESFVSGLLIFSWLGYMLVIQPIPDIRFDVRTFHRVANHNKLSASMENAYWSLSSGEFDSHSLSQRSIAILPAKQKKLFQAMMKQLGKSRSTLARKIRKSINMRQATQHLRTHLQKDIPRARNYPAFYLRNVFRPRALHLDMAIVLTRSLCIGFLMLFSIRLFFDESSTPEE